MSIVIIQNSHFDTDETVILNVVDIFIFENCVRVALENEDSIIIPIHTFFRITERQDEEN